MQFKQPLLFTFLFVIKRYKKNVNIAVHNRVEFIFNINVWKQQRVLCTDYWYIYGYRWFSIVL
jgi:hypothetical protein